MTGNDNCKIFSLSGILSKYLQRPILLLTFLLKECSNTRKLTSLKVLIKIHVEFFFLSFTNDHNEQKVSVNLLLRTKYWTTKLKKTSGTTSNMAEKSYFFSLMFSLLMNIKPFAISKCHAAIFMKATSTKEVQFTHVNARIEEFQGKRRWSRSCNLKFECNSDSYKPMGFST